MAAGDALFVLTPLMCSDSPYFGETGATLGQRSYPIISYDDTSNESRDWSGLIMKHYYTSGANIDVSIVWMAASATTGSCRWQLGFRVLEPDVDDIDLTFTYTFAGGSVAPASASGEPVVSTFTISSSSVLDSIAPGDPFIFRVLRDSENVLDDMSGDAQIECVYLRESP